MERKNELIVKSNGSIFKASTLLSSHDVDETPEFSIIIPHKDEEKRIPRIKDQYSRLLNYPFEVVVVGGEVKNSAIARDVGAQKAIGDKLIFTDAHVCINNDVNNLKETLDDYPNCFVTTLYSECNFDTDMKFRGAKVGGVHFDKAMNWSWNWPKSMDRPFTAPCGCACFMAVKKNTYNNVRFLHMSTKACAMDEEILMRGWLLGYPHIVDPSVYIGHYFPGDRDNPAKHPDKPIDYVVYHNAITVVVNFDGEVFDEIYKECKEKWGDVWDKQVERAREVWRDYANEMSQKRNEVWGDNLQNVERWIVTNNDDYAPSIENLYPAYEDVKTTRPGLHECLFPRAFNRAISMRTREQILPRFDCFTRFLSKF